MGKEFQVIKDIATISATIAELASIDKIMRNEIESRHFLEEYDLLIFDIQNTYKELLDTLDPLVFIDNPSTFKAKFNELFQVFSDKYAATHSLSRVNAELTFEKYLQFRKRKEVSTGYPPLKRNFARLHDFIDKWIDNDIWLSMTIDTLLKTLYLHLNEVNGIAQKDKSGAFSLFNSCIGNLAPYLTDMRNKLYAIDPSFDMSKLKGSAA